MFFSRMAVATRLYVGFGLILALLVVLTGIAVVKVGLAQLALGRARLARGETVDARHALSLAELQLAAAVGADHPAARLARKLMKESEAGGTSMH